MQKIETSNSNNWNNPANETGRKKLSPGQISRLRKGFQRKNDTPEEAAVRSWRGMTLAAIAQKFGEQEGLAISPWTVRHYYQQLKDDKANPAIELGRGRRRRAVNRPVIVPAHASLCALTQAVWSLTGFSIPDIHRLYELAANNNGWKLPTVQHFRRIISGLHVEGIRHTPSRNLMDRHSLRLLPIQIVPGVGSCNIWLVLAGFELITGFIHLAVFKTKRGLEDLSATVIADFIREACDRLALPINRVEVNGGREEIFAELCSKLPGQQIVQGNVSLPADCSIPEELSTAGRFCNFLTEALAAYIENSSKAKLVEARKAIFDEFQLVKGVKGRPWSMKRIRLKYPETDKQLLTAFCEKYLETVAAVDRVQVTSLKMLTPG
jgi:hypothetical protein